MQLVWFRTPSRYGLGVLAGMMMERFVREPLVHFLALGLLLFGGYTLLEDNRSEDSSSKEVHLTLEDLAQLEILFESKWRRLPTPEEFEALVESRIQEDILYREALALGLDKDDTIVKRRMAQKMQFLAEDIAAAREPTDDELRSWFAQYGDLFSLPARVSFRHLYFSTDERGGRARDDAAKVLSKLAGRPQDSNLAVSLADPFMFQDYYGDRTPQALAREFGPGFAEAIVKLVPGSWQGPIESGYGWHLVFVDSVVPGRVSAFEEVEQDVKAAWLGQQKAMAWKKAYAKMRAKYTVLLPVPFDGAAAAEPETTRKREVPTPDGEAPR